MSTSSKKKRFFGFKRSNSKIGIAPASISSSNASDPSSKEQDVLNDKLKALENQKNEELAEREKEIEELKIANRNIEELVQKLEKDLKVEKSVQQTAEIEATHDEKKESSPIEPNDEPEPLTKEQLRDELQSKDDEIPALSEQLSKADISVDNIIKTWVEEMETESEAEHEMDAYKQMAETDQNLDKLTMQLKEKDEVIEQQIALIEQQEEKIHRLKAKKTAIRRKSRTDKATIARLSHAVADKVMKFGQYDEMKAELQEKEQKINELKEENLSKQQQIDERQMELNVVYERCENLERKAEEYEKMIERLNTMNAIEKRTYQLEPSAPVRFLSCKTDKELIEKLIEQCVENEAEFEKYKKKIKRRNSKIEALTKKSMELKRRSSLDEETIDSLWKEMGEKEVQCDELKKELAEREEEIGEMMEKLNDALGTEKKPDYRVAGGLGGVVVTTRQYRLKTECNRYLDMMNKKIQAMDGFEGGIWEKKREIPRNNSCGKIRFSFNYFGDDIMAYDGVNELAEMLKSDGNVNNVKIEDQKYVIK